MSTVAPDERDGTFAASGRMTAPSAPTDRDVLGNATIRRVQRRILPFLVLCYIIAFVDRVNIGFAASYMNTDLGFDAKLYGFGAGIFAIGYFLFEVPSNLALHKFGARLWIPRIMVSWGVIAAAFAFIHNDVMFIVLRFLLGVAEAGFFPGIVLYLALWFPKRALGRATAIFILGLPLAVLIGAPMSAGLISGLDGVVGISGWRWMFLVQGLFAVVVGIIAYFRLGNEPRSAEWLTVDQRDWLVETLAAERSVKEAVRRYSVFETLRNRRVLILSATIFCNITALFGITLWMPQIISQIGEVRPTTANLLTAVPYLFAGIAMLANSIHSDRTGERRFHILIPAVLGGLGLIAAVSTSSPIVALASMCVAAAGILSSNILFWGLPTMFLTGAAAAAGIAVVNSVGNLGGFVGPYLTGWAVDVFGNYRAGMFILAALIITYGLSTFIYLTVQTRRDVAIARAKGISDLDALRS